MESWVTTITGSNEQAIWTALAKFGRIGGAVQAANSTSENIQFMEAGRVRFNGDFTAMFNYPWRTWISIAEKAVEVGDFELAVRVFFFAWTVQDQVTFDMNSSAEVGFGTPAPEVFKEIASAANTAAICAPDEFAVIERTGSAPVTKATILSGTNQILGIGPPN